MVRDPLTVPVAEATVEELSAQAAHHGLNATLTTLKEFLENPEEIEKVIGGVESVFDIDVISQTRAVTHTRGDGTGEIIETMDLIRLSNRGPEGWLVFFRGQDSLEASYGVQSRTSGTVEKRSITEIRLSHGTEAISAMARCLLDLQLRIDMAHAIARTSRPA